ncbi:Y4yA family PLP-dependent enzyme [Symbioplanes lichenis]|uniref:Y4yA family PLP-dependent enzyme n=1 Tax=Symbioplanes lichenis TaxID=1629072 RepID=UPI002739DEF4|nr:Y4yA family PLP-dependent enzyme [Actinoplanes lichenis]
MTLSLSPRINEFVHSVLGETALLGRLVEALGSPLDIVLPEQAGRNVAAFRAVHAEHRLGGRIYFAHKANRSSALVRELAAGDAGIDVASLGELQHALGAGFTPDRIVATGPKNAAFLWLCARTSVLVHVDSAAEVAELGELVRARGLPPVRILLRLSEFAAPGVRTAARRSRFGVSPDGLESILDLAGKYAGHLEPVGVGFHLDTTALPEKAVALEGCLTALETCRRRGLRPWAIDAGGGFGVSYLADPAEWDDYTSALTEAVLGRRAPLTWNGHGYGLRNEGGTIGGSLGLYPAYRQVTGPAYLDQLLRTRAPGLGRPLGELLLDSMVDLHVEPGRALLDQCGLVLAKVLEVRDDPGGLIVRLDCNAGDVSTENHGVLMDPVAIPQREGPAEGAYLFGNLCLESDLITRRKVFLRGRPRAGDLLAFVNTAGYFMDFGATEALRQPIARKVALFRSDDAWQWCLDDQYWPLHRETA